MTSKVNDKKPSMVRKLTQLLKDKKTMVYIDGSNLYYMISKTKTRFSYEAFQNWMKTRSKLQGIHYYTAFDPEDPRQTDFLSDLEKFQYSIHKKPIKWVIDHHKGNMDVELAIDAITMSGEYEVMVLLSGDGDFSYLCKELERLGKKTIVISLGGYTAPELHDSADNYFFMERVNTIWKPIQKRSKKQPEKVETVKDPKSLLDIPKIYI